MAQHARYQTSEPPLILTVPGLENSGPDHWQTHWEQALPHCRRVELGMWDRPHRNTWVNQLNLAVRAADRPVILAAHSLGCFAVAWWAALEPLVACPPARGGSVLGALLVAPPRVDAAPLDPRIASFGPSPRKALPFPAILVGSRDDPYLGYDEAVRLAARWGARFVDAGAAGHINAASGLGEWPFGQRLLGRLGHDPVPAPTPPQRRHRSDHAELPSSGRSGQHGDAGP